MPKQLKVILSTVLMLLIISLIAKLYATNKDKNDSVQRYEDAKVKIESLVKDIDSISQVSDSIRTDNKTLQKEIKYNESVLRVLNAVIDTNNHKIADYKKRISFYTENKKKLEIKLHANEELLKEKDSEINKLEEDFKAVSQALSLSDKARIKLETEVKFLKGNLKQSDNRREDLLNINEKYLKELKLKTSINDSVKELLSGYVYVYLVNITGNRNIQKILGDMKPFIDRNIHDTEQYIRLRKYHEVFNFIYKNNLAIDGVVLFARSSGINIEGNANIHDLKIALKKFKDFQLRSVISCIARDLKPSELNEIMRIVNVTFPI